MNFALTPEQEMVVTTVRAFVEHELYPLEAEVERTGEVPAEVGREIMRKVQELGFYAPNIPEEFGGGGLDHLTFTLLAAFLGRPGHLFTKDELFKTVWAGRVTYRRWYSGWTRKMDPMSEIPLTTSAKRAPLISSE